jgi:hypothetical protein
MFIAEAQTHHPFSAQVTCAAHVTCAEKNLGMALQTINIGLRWSPERSGFLGPGLLSRFCGASSCLPRIQPDLD